MTKTDCIIFIVDDDPRVCEALGDLLEANGMMSHAFHTVGDYLSFVRPDLPACLILDVELPDLSGLEFQGQIKDEGHPPIVFVTGHGDISSSVRAMKMGAVDFLTKPFQEDEMLDAVHAAIAHNRTYRQEKAELSQLQQRLSTLTEREREVLPLVASGLLNKQAAAEIGVSQITLQIHRSKIMQKMEAASLADLVRIAERLRIPVTHSRRSGVLPK